MLMAKLKMPVIQSEELTSFNNTLTEVDEKFCIPGKNKPIILINLSKKPNPKLCRAIKELVLISSAKPVLHISKRWLPTLQEY